MRVFYPHLLDYALFRVHRSLQVPRRYRDWFLKRTRLPVYTFRIALWPDKILVSRTGTPLSGFTDRNESTMRGEHLQLTN